MYLQLIAIMINGNFWLNVTYEARRLRYDMDISWWGLVQRSSIQDRWSLVGANILTGETIYNLR